MSCASRHVTLCHSVTKHVKRLFNEACLARGEWHLRGSKHTREFDWGALGPSGSLRTFQVETENLGHECLAGAHAVPRSASRVAAGPVAKHDAATLMLEIFIAAPAPCRVYAHTLVWTGISEIEVLMLLYCHAALTANQWPTFFC